MNTRAKNKNICKIQNCGLKTRYKELCNSHYIRLWRFGNAEYPLKYRKRGTGHITHDGYKLFAQKREHRKIMEEQLGRKLTEKEHVHHINGNRSDNGIENLKVMSIEEHGRLHGKETKGIPRLALRKAPVYYLCLLCNNSFQIKDGQYTQKYCSRKCYWIHKKDLMKIYWSLKNGKKSQGDWLAF